MSRIKKPEKCYNVFTNLQVSIRIQNKIYAEDSINYILFGIPFCCYGFLRDLVDFLANCVRLFHSICSVLMIVNKLMK